jgi:hypothetical protein
MYLEVGGRSSIAGKDLQVLRMLHLQVQGVAHRSSPETVSQPVTLPGESYPVFPVHFGTGQVAAYAPPMRTLIHCTINVVFATSIRRRIASHVGVLHSSS